ncbi:transcriptional regulator tetR/acrR family [Xanthomonas campestris pv. campestris str. 8004]|uniref:Transcriptional regulator tetR/acrR family n=3 Tax=Xanthomonas TaxID=338 RepID=A0A0H2XAV7_XANC8|nr:transcriptional regulator tetR/acrR family [Xanthomonas campestris pv. campestris str. 8004]QCX67081.1 TetR/AcrR family transcriptional regulator [Xanthomonas campestris pv. campestris]QCX72422.1 TetR/AcrR family transcriptional regulator [Xanthomonas campestris pv. campestris]RFF49826.1 TetR/AcrR family transcriptional regulator [Xanthomonas campestris pv. campestris]RFF77050.1 TetR/AcrR family transcriptional regulator [Xanthomonas campestris pv. campestris]
MRQRSGAGRAEHRLIRPLVGECVHSVSGLWRNRTNLSDNAGMTAPRPDAALRRRQILDAADEVFSEHGVNAPLELVVERAGLGRATLYRNFPDRLALMTALMERGLDGLERLAADLGDRPDGLAVLLHDVAEHIAQSAPMVDFWRSIERAHPSVKAVDQRVVGIFLPFVQRAKQAGLCRADLDEEQLVLVMDMLGSCLRGSDEAERKRLAHRSADLLMHALGMPVPVGGTQ